MKISVTFDSNVWESIVDEVKRANSDPTFTDLLEFIKMGLIQPYFFEGFATIESIKKIDRKSYVGNYQAGFSVSVNGEEMYSREGSRGQEISEYLNNLVPHALSIGFRFTRLPRIGAPSLDIPSKYRAPDDKYSIEERLERSFECARFIESLGSGKGMVMSQIGATVGGFVQKTKANTSISDKRYAKAVGEWADGDALAANYGYGIDYFCTNDRASGAGSSSIFHPTNLQQLEQRYPVNVVSPQELVQRLRSGNA